LVIVTLASFCLAQSSTSTEQEQAIVAITKFGGTVEVDSLSPDKPVLKVDLLKVWRI